MAQTNKAQNKPAPKTEIALGELRSVVMMRTLEIDPAFEAVTAHALAGRIRKESKNFPDKLAIASAGTADDDFLIERAVTRMFENLVLLCARLEINLDEVLPMIWDDESDRSEINIDMAAEPEAKGKGSGKGEK